MKYFFIFIFSFSILQASSAQITEEQEYIDSDIDRCIGCPPHNSPKRQYLKGKYGFSLGNKWIIPAEYKRLDSKFSNFIVAMKDDKYGVIDSTNTEILPFEYDAIKPLYTKFTEKNVNFFHLKKGKKNGIIHKNGELILPIVHTHFKKVKDSLYAVGNTELGYGLIYRNGKKVTKLQFEEPLKKLRKGILLAKKNGKFGIIDDTGKKLTDYKWSSITANTSSFTVENNGKFGILDSSLKLRIKPIYDEIYTKDGSAFITTSAGKNGLISKDYEEVVPPVYYNMKYTPPFYFSCQRTEFKSYGVFNDKGKLILDFFYGFIKEGPGSLFFITKNRKYGVFNEEGLEIIPPTYSNVETLKNDFARVRMGRGSESKCALMNAKGELITDFIYDSMYLTNGKIGAKRGYFSGTLNHNGDENKDFISYEKEVNQQLQQIEDKKTEIFSLLEGDWLGALNVQGKTYLTGFEFFGNEKGLRTFYYLQNEKKCAVTSEITLKTNPYHSGNYTEVVYNVRYGTTSATCDLDTAPFPKKNFINTGAYIPVRDEKDNFSLFRFQKVEKDKDLSYKELLALKKQYKIE